MPEILPNWHPLIVHFAIALLLTGAGLFGLGTGLRGRAFAAAATQVARWNLVLGVLSALVALATGWQAYNSVAHDAASHANMTVHMRWAFGTVALFAGALVPAWLERRRAAGAGPVLLTSLAAASVALVVTGWLGGENVYRYGLGVLSLPKADGHMHGGHHHHHHDEPAADGGEAEPAEAHHNDEGEKTGSHEDHFIPNSPAAPTDSAPSAGTTSHADPDPARPPAPR